MLELLIETEDQWNVAGRCNDNNGTLTHLFFQTTSPGESHVR